MVRMTNLFQQVGADLIYRREMQRIPCSKARNIGVSNFGIRHLEALSYDKLCNVVPAVNQVEVCIDDFKCYV